MYRRLIAVCGAVVAVVLSLGLCACKSDAEKVEDAVRPTLESYVQQSDEDKDEDAPAPDYGDSETASVLEAYGLDVDRLHELCFARYGFEVGEAKVSDDGAMATVDVSITNVSLAGAAKNAANDYAEYQNSDEALSAYAENGHKALLQHLFELLFTHLQSDETVTTVVTLSLTKNEDGEWAFDRSENDAFYNALYGGSNVLGGLATALE